MKLKQTNISVLSGPQAYLLRWLEYDTYIDMNILQTIEKNLKILITEEGDILASKYKYKDRPEEWYINDDYNLFIIDIHLTLRLKTLTMLSLN